MLRESWLVSAIVGACVAAQASAQTTPDVSQILSQRPIQTEAVVDNPSRETWKDCKIEPVKSPARGWIVRDGRSLVVRQFLDSTGNGVVDQWSFYLNGQEVYRESDRNRNGKADLFRWYYNQGSRQGVDTNEDGKVDQWQSISAEEATAEAVSAFAGMDAARMQRVLLDDNDIRTLGIAPAAADRIRTTQRELAKPFERTARSLSSSVQWSRLEGNDPQSIPANDAGASADLLILQNATILADVKGQTRWLRVPEIVRVQDTWKLSAMPILMDPEKPADVVSVLLPSQEQPVVSTRQGTADEAMIEEGEEIQKLVLALQEHDQSLPADQGDGRAMAAYHVKRAEWCAKIGSKSAKLKNREHWYRQTADSLNAAVQTGVYDQGVATLGQFADQFSKTNWGGNLAGYFTYRAINSDYALQLAKGDADHAKVQQDYLEKLAGFLEKYPESDDTDDALLQLGNGMEFAGKEDVARDSYQRLVSKFPKSPSVAKASGALRRLNAVGQPFQLVGNSLASNAKLDVSRYAGKVVVINYWATWCEPCKAEMPRLRKLRERFGAQGLEVVGVALDTDPAAPQEYVKSKGYTWPQMFEPGSMESPLAVQYGVISLPYLILIDGQGRVLNRNLQFNNLEQEVEKALADKIASSKK